MGKQVLRTPAGIKGRVLMSKYLVDFLESIYDGQKPSNFGERMVTRNFIKRIRKIHNFLDLKKPLIYSRRMVPEYLIKRYNDVDFFEVTKDDMAYQVIVPEGSQKYVLLNKLGGMSYKSENLIALNDVAETTNSYGITYKIEKGVIYLNGTATGTHNITLNISNLELNGTYSCNGFNTTDKSNCVINLYNGNTYISYIYGYGNAQRENLSISSTITKILINISSGATLTNAVIKPMLVKGSTAPTEFKEGFEGIRDSAVTSVVSKDSEDTTIDTLTIDSNITALEGYGWGVNDTCYNYIDYDSKKFIQKVGRVDLGSLNWVYDSTYEKFNVPYINIKPNTLNALVSNNYSIQNGGFDSQSIPNKTLSIHNSSSIIFIKDTAYTDATTFKTAMSGVYLYYELATPVETDISEYLEDEAYIEVAPGGSITFENEYDNDVPSEITYLLEV